MALGKQPRHEVHGADRHAHAEHDAGEQALRSAFPERERHAADDDGHQTQAARDRAR